MDCTQVLPSTSSSNTYEKTEKKRVATLTINGITHNIYNCENVIGRAEICNIVIRNEAISSRHAVIEADEYEEHVIYDLGSTNKTKLGKTTLKPNVRYFINDGTKLVFAEENALYKYVAQCRTPTKQETNFTIPETPEKSDSSPVRTFEFEKDNEIIESSDIDMFEEQFEEEIRLRVSGDCNSTNEQDPAINENKKSRVKSNSVNSENEKLRNKEEVLNICHNENHTSQMAYSEMKTKEKEENLEISIYDIPTQNFMEETDVAETVVSIRKADTQQLSEELDKETSYSGNDENVRSAEFSDIHDDDTLDPLEFENDCDFKKDDADKVPLKKHEEIVSMNKTDEDVMQYSFEDDNAFSNHKGKSVTEIHTQDLLYRNRDSDSDDEMFVNTQHTCDDNERQKLKSMPENKSTDVIGQSICSIVEENNDTTLKKITNTECEVKSSEYQAKTTNQNKSPFSNENLCLSKVEVSATNLISQPLNSYKKVTTLDDIKEEEFKFNYKEKKIKLSQMMKPSTEFISSPNANNLGSSFCSGKSEILNETNIALFKSVTNKDSTLKEETSKLKELRKTENVPKDSTILENLSLCHLHLQPEVQIEYASMERNKSSEKIKQSKKVDEKEKYAEKGNIKQIVQLQKIPNKGLNDSINFTETAEERGMSLGDKLTQSIINPSETTCNLLDESSKSSKNRNKKDHKMNEFSLCESEIQLVTPTAMDNLPSRSYSNGTLHPINDKNKKDDEMIELGETENINELRFCEMETQPVSPTVEDLSSGNLSIAKLHLNDNINKDDSIIVAIGEKENIIDVSLCALQTQAVSPKVEDTFSGSDSKGTTRLHRINNTGKKENAIIGAEASVFLPSSENSFVRNDSKKDDKYEEIIGVEEKDIINELSDMQTQPVLTSMENPSSRSNFHLNDDDIKICDSQLYLTLSNTSTPKEGTSRTNSEGKDCGNGSAKKHDKKCKPKKDRSLVSNKYKKGNKKYCEEDLKVNEMLQPVLLPKVIKPEKEEDMNDLSISDMLTQPVLPPAEHINEKEEVSSDCSVSDILTQPVLSPKECRSLKEEVMKDLNIGDMLTQPILLPIEHRSEEEGVRSDLNISDMPTQPVFPPTGRKSEKEEVTNDLSISDMLTQPVLPPIGCRSEKEEVTNDLNITDMPTQPVLYPVERRSVKEAVNDLSISEMLTQPVLPPTERTSEKEEVMNDLINISDMVTQPILLPIVQRSEEEGVSSDLNISNMPTQPVLPPTERKSEKEEVTDDLSISDMLTQSVLIQKENSTPKNNSNTGKSSVSTSSSSANVCRKKDKKTRTSGEGADVYPTKEDFPAKSSNLVIEESANDIEQSNSQTENQKQPGLSKVKKSIDSTSSMNDCSSLGVGKTKIFTKQRLKSFKNVIPELRSEIDTQSMSTEILSAIEVRELLAEEVFPNLKRVEELQNELNIKKGESEGMMSDNDCKTKINKNSSENRIFLLESLKKNGELGYPKRDLVSSPRSENSDKFEQSETEMGRGKRKRVKKLFEGFCTDENLKAEIGQNTIDHCNLQSERLCGSLPLKKRKKKDDAQNTESSNEISYPILKHTENVNTRKRKKRASQNDSEIAASISLNKEIDNGNELNVVKKRKDEYKNAKNNVRNVDQSNESLKLSIEEELNNVSPCHDDCSSTFCSKSWNTPKNMSDIKTYSKKKSLPTKESDNSSFFLKEKSKKFIKDSLELQHLENINFSPVVKLKRCLSDVKQNQSEKKAVDQNEEKLQLSHSEKPKDPATLNHIENTTFIKEQLTPLKTSTPATKVSKRIKKIVVDEMANNQIIKVPNKSGVQKEKHKKSSKEISQPIAQSDSNVADLPTINLDKNLIKLRQTDKMTSNSLKLIKGIKKAKLQPNGEMSEASNAEETNICHNPVNTSKIKTNSKKKSFISEENGRCTELKQEADENSLKVENYLQIASNKLPKKSVKNEKLTLPKNVGNTVAKSTVKNLKENSDLIEEKLDPIKSTTSLTKVPKRVNTNNVKEANNKKTRTKNKGEKISLNDSEDAFDKTPESSPARRSNRQRKINSMLQLCYGPTEKVMFTGYSDPKAVTVINKLGGQVVDCAHTCTVLVTDKVRRTVKFLCALALGRPIVSPAWLTSSKTSCSFLDYEKYLLRDKDAEKQFSFNLKESLIKAKRKPFLEGVSIFVTNSVKPPPSEMKSIIECSGGIFLNKISPNWPDNSVIISCKEDRSQFNKIKKVSSTHQIVSSEFILTGLLQQNFEPEKYFL